METEPAVSGGNEELNTVVFLDELIVSGVPESMREKARQEIELAVGALKGLDSLEAAARKVERIGVRYLLVEDFQETVRSVLSKDQKEVSKPYEAIRQESMAVGKTMFEREQGNLKAAIILPGDLWRADTGQQAFIRLYLLFHEGAHVFIEAGRDGTEKRIDGFKGSVERLARSLREEYGADRLAASIFEATGIATNERSEVITLKDVIGDWFVESASRLLDSLGAWVEECVQGYRERRQPLDRIATELTPRLEELFVVLAHLLGINSEPGGAERCKKWLSSSLGFKTYLADHWERFVNALTSDDRETGRAELCDVFFEVIRLCGVEVEDLGDEKFFVHVFEPRFMAS